jgi:hypothetical protein
MSNATKPWRSDPDLAGRFHPEYPDDLQFMAHDGEPRRTGRQGELCWARMIGVERAPKRTFSEPIPAAEWVYLATLLNAPTQLSTIRQGDTIRLLSGTGVEHPLLVTQQYLAERPLWTIRACDRCGLREVLDPPSVMVKLRFPSLPEGHLLHSFTSFCVLCGGGQVLSLTERLSNQ